MVVIYPNINYPVVYRSLFYISFLQPDSGALRCLPGHRYDKLSKKLVPGASAASCTEPPQRPTKAESIKPWSLGWLETC